MDYITCSKCGAKIEKESVYCRKCGAKINVDKSPKSPKRWFWIVIAIVAFAIVVVAVVLMFYSRSEARYFDRLDSDAKK